MAQRLLRMVRITPLHAAIGPICRSRLGWTSWLGSSRARPLAHRMPGATAALVNQSRGFMPWTAI